MRGSVEMDSSLSNFGILQVMDQVDDLMRAVGDEQRRGYCLTLTPASLGGSPINLDEIGATNGYSRRTASLVKEKTQHTTAYLS